MNDRTDHSPCPNPQCCPPPRTGNGYSESEATKDDIELDMRLKAFRRDFDQIPSNSSVKDIIRKPFRRGK